MVLRRDHAKVIQTDIRIHKYGLSLTTDLRQHAKFQDPAFSLGAVDPVLIFLRRTADKVMPVHQIAGIRQTGELFRIKFLRIVIVIVLFASDPVMLPGKLFYHRGLPRIGSTDHEVGVFKK